MKHHSILWGIYRKTNTKTKKKKSNIPTSGFQKAPRGFVFSLQTGACPCPQNTDTAHSALPQATRVRLQSKARALPDLLADPEHLLSPLPRRKEKQTRKGGTEVGFKVNYWELGGKELGNFQ